MNANKKHNRIPNSTKFWVYALPLFYICIQILNQFPNFVETVYSRNLYTVFRSIFHFSLSWIPFSVGDLFYIILIVLAIQFIFRLIRKKFKNWKHSLVYAIAFLSKIYVFFHLLWGLNYYRVPLHEQLQIENEYTTFELINFTEKLIEQTNTLHLQLKENDSLPVDFNYNHENISKLVFDGIDAVNEPKINLNYGRRNLKKSLFSVPLTYGGFGGYLNPFSLEAQYNNEIPYFKWPTTLTHEVAHQMGFAKENEANFIACLVGLQHEDESFRYATYGFALKKCLNELFYRDPALFEELKQCVNYGVIENYRELQEFWKDYQNPIEPLLKIMYGSYLNINNQPDGMKSYDYVVALLVNYDFSF